MEPSHSITLLVPEIKELLAEKNYVLLKQVMRESNPLDFADAWKRFAEEERLQLFKLLPGTAALKLFEILDIEDQRYLLGKLSEENVTPLLEGMESPDLAKLFHKMSPRLAKKMTSLIKRQEALAHIDLLMKFPEHSAGSLMHPEFVKLTPKLTAKQATSLLQAIARPYEKEHLYSLFVTDEEGRLLGALTLQDLFSAPEDERLSELMTSAEAVKVRPETDQEEAAKLFSKYGLTAAPVVNGENRLVGILTAKDILSVVRQEATEDIAKMAGTRASDVEERSVLKIVRFRMPWLVTTLLGELLVAAIIRAFEPTLSEMLVLASFLPLIAAMGGNVGSQSAMIMVRSIALGTVNGNGKFRAVFREARVGFLLGLCYAVILGLAAFFLFGRSFSDIFPVIIGLSICVSMTVAATIGSVGPLLLQRVGVDPATATGPLITTTTDIISTSFYFVIATVMLAYVR
ncbi:MAG: magnesium transporter [Candidatus Omnitrophica bacterium]|nr:magnesium transporter [Candidatus Omnitrophota bacterium]